MYDFHMHSNYSADCETPMEQTIQSAIQKGLKEICFTEHVDYDYPDPTIQFDLDVVRYTEEIMSLQKKYRDQITIRKGVEIGVQPHVLKDCEKLVDENYFDFIICSLHASDRKNLHHGDFFEGRTAEEAYQFYYEELLQCVRTYEHYSILGHIDLVKRYKTLDVDRNFHDILEEIFRVIIPKGKGIEVNTSGFAYGLGSAMPSRDILQLYKDCGGEIITIGSDAHKAEHVAHEFPKTLQLLQEIGFEYIATFEAQKPIFHSIDNIVTR